MPDPQRISIKHEHVVDADYSRQVFTKFTAVGATFTDCRFDRARIEDASFGAGMELTQLVGCSFDGASLRALGGFTRFVNCTFRNLRVSSQVPDHVEFVDCSFTGRITGLQFWGAPANAPGEYARLTTSLAQRGLPEPPGLERLIVRERNDIRGNDLSEAQLVKVNFRFGVDLTAQRLPAGDDYLYLADPVTTVPLAQAELARNPDEAAPRAREFLQDLLDREVAFGQRQLWLCPKDFESKGVLRPHVALAVDELRRVLKDDTHIRP